jgi:hypothetical protein
MKKLIVLFSVIGISISCAFGQTYYYKHVETVDKNGAKTKGVGGQYITFSGNTCYVSDKDGRKSYDYFGAMTTLEYIYKGKQNNILVFEFKKVLLNMRYEYYYYFSTDYDRLNEPIGEGTKVYKRSDPSSLAPKELY